jgi:hypothetical protein
LRPGSKIDNVVGAQSRTGRRECRTRRKLEESRGGCSSRKAARAVRRGAPVSVITIHNPPGPGVGDGIVEAGRAKSGLLREVKGKSVA